MLLDVEGTTTPIAFVREVLFPCAEARLEEACAQAADEPRIAAAVERLAEEYRGESASFPDLEFGDGGACSPGAAGLVVSVRLAARDRA